MNPFEPPPAPEPAPEDRDEDEIDTELFGGNLFDDDPPEDISALKK